jgi:hypothetical protein
MSNVVKFPYDACRRVHSQKPRRSKNGTPEERAVKAAALLPSSADVVPMADAREQARSEVDGRKLRGSPLRDCIRQFANLSLTKQLQSSASATAPSASRQLQEGAGGVAPAGFFSGIEHFLMKGCPMPLIKREVRRARRIWAWIRVQNISSGGAKIAKTTSALVPDRFDLAFAEGGQTRSCEVIWRHGRICGVKFAS